MVRWLGEAVDRTKLALHRRDGGGIRVLDAIPYESFADESAEQLTVRIRELFVSQLKSEKDPLAPVH